MTTADPFAFQFCSGLGQFDSRRRAAVGEKPNLSPLAGMPYDGITEDEIAALVADPVQLEKRAGRWLIPSLYLASDARNHEMQRARGKFGWLALDVDKGNHDSATVDRAVMDVLGDVRRFVYATPSSKRDNRKWRALVPLARLISGADYADSAAAFYDLLLEKSGGAIHADRTLCRAGQLIYLPNHGEHYESKIVEGPRLELSPIHPVIRRRDATRRKLAAAEAEVKAQRVEKTKTAARPEDSVIAAFNVRNSIVDAFVRYGYEDSGNDWRSPYQGTGSFATRDLGDHWVSLSGSDAAEGLGRETRNGNRTGDAFDLFVHYEHDGDFAAAVKAYADVLAGIGWRQPSADDEFEAVNDDDDATGPAVTGLRIVCAASFAGRPVPQRQALDSQNMIPMRTVTGLGGDGGTGKSQLALQLGCGVAMTGTWLGTKVRRGPVLFYNAEDDQDELHARASDIAKADGFALSDLTDLHIAVMAGEDAVLASEDMKKGRMAETPVLRMVREAMTRLRPVLLVLDNLADAFSGNENNRTLARQFVGILRKLAIEFDCAVLLLYHPSLSGLNSGAGTGGSTAWSNSYRSRLYLRREVDSKGEERNKRRRVLEHKKANYAGGDLVLSLEWEAGRYTPLDGLNELDGTFDASARTQRAERVFLDLVRWHRHRRINISASLGRNYAPTVFSQHELAEGFGLSDFRKAMEVLLDRETIERKQFGPPSRPEFTLVIVTEEETV